MAPDCISTAFAKTMPTRWTVFPPSLNARLHQESQLLTPGERTKYGHTWCHSHFALQAWEGVLGGIIINGPATANYDEDLGVMFLNDWSRSLLLIFSAPHFFNQY